MNRELWRQLLVLTVLMMTVILAWELVSAIVYTKLNKCSDESQYQSGLPQHIAVLCYSCWQDLYTKRGQVLPSVQRQSDENIRPVVLHPQELS